MSSTYSSFDTLIPKLLFIDIETVSAAPDWHSLSDELQALWSLKATQLQRYTDAKVDDATLYHERAGIFAEFGKIVCISVGYLQANESQEGYTLTVKSLADDDERGLLVSFYEVLNKLESKNRSTTFVGHNIKEFDLPYICRRSLIHGLALPKSLQLTGMKPWEIPHLDTLELWRFGDYKHYISLKLMASIFGIPSPKDDLDGSQVTAAYWQEQRLQDIATYCNKDVATVAHIFLKLKNIVAPITVVNK